MINYYVSGQKYNQSKFKQSKFSQAENPTDEVIWQNVKDPLAFLPTCKLQT